MYIAQICILHITEDSCILFTRCTVGYTQSCAKQQNTRDFTGWWYHYLL